MATRGRSPHEPGQGRRGKLAGGVRAATAPRRGAARQARPGLPGPLRSLDGDPSAPVPGVGADRTRTVGPGAHRDPLPHRLPRLRDIARVARGDCCRPARAAGDSALLRRRPPRDDAKHTKRWAIEHDVELAGSDDPADRQLGVDRRLLEEPRMEAHGVREFPPDSVRGRFVRTALKAAVTDVILPAFVAHVVELAAAGRPLTRDLAARATVYLHARTHYGIVDPAALNGLRELWRAALGDKDLTALDDLYARVVWIPDGELDRLDHAAREYREIVGEPDEPPNPSGSGGPVGSGEGGGESGSDPSEGGERDGGAGTGSLAGALQEAIASARADQLEQLDLDVDLQQVLANASAGGRLANQLGKGTGTGLPTGRMPV